MTTHSQPSSSHLAHLNALTSLRFFAAFAIVLFHVPSTLSRSVGWELLPLGQFGVFFFFILSGFILMHVYQNKPIKIWEFYRKRFARIYPLHIAIFLIWAVLFFKGWGNPLPDKINSGIANALLLNAFFIGAVYNLGFNAVSWSISVEAFFYLLFPFLKRHKIYLIAFLLWAYGYLLLPTFMRSWITDADPGFFYFNPLAHLLEFTAGMTFYSFRSSIKPGFGAASGAQFAALILMPFICGAVPDLPDRLRYIALVFSFGLIILSFSYHGLLANILSRKPLIVLGEASFVLYMIHHMIFTYVDETLSRHFNAAQSLGVAITLVIMLSLSIHYGFERPVRIWVSGKPAKTVP